MLKAKYLIDIVLSIIALIVALPLMLLLTLILWILHGKCPFFAQQRVGKNQKSFTIIKFKTESGKRTCQNSSFIRFVRESHLDELPQFFNIIQGSMSIVGPRPHIPEHVQNYEEWQKKRLSVKPGLTCLRQLKSPRKKILYNELIEDDIWYVENWSLGLDFKIMGKTLFAFMGLLFKR
ncbi:MAG: sugar transferase [Tenuifilaceae bacterium]|nr:sugar transferase [Tenuifilaceae bacterium]